MSTMKPRATSFAPQFLVDDLERSIAYYRKFGFTEANKRLHIVGVGHNSNNENSDSTPCTYSTSRMKRNLGRCAEH
jgi:hypothetical protein